MASGWSTPTPTCCTPASTLQASRYLVLKRMAQKPQPDEQSVLWQQHIQDDILDACDDAEYVVVDRRASYLLRPEVLAHIWTTPKWPT